VENTQSSIIAGHSHSFDIGIARHVGINAAIVFNHIAYWIKFNAAKKEAKMIDGKFWMYETQQDIANFLNYLTLEEVKKAVVKLLDVGLLIKRNFNKNPFDRTNWYALGDQSEIQKTFTKEPIGAMGSSDGLDLKLPDAPSLHIHNKHLHKKNIIIATCDPPAPKGGNNNFFECLKDCKDLSDRQKSQLSKYPERVVASAMKYCYHPATKLEGPAARIKQLHAFCQNPDDYAQTMKSIDDPNHGKTVKEKILSTFKRGTYYNGYEFCVEESGPYFLHPNGSNVYGVRWDEKDFEKKWTDNLQRLGIKPN
jgi:hypothetical protein